MNFPTETGGSRLRWTPFMRKTDQSQNLGWNTLKLLAALRSKTWIHFLGFWALDTNWNPDLHCALHTLSLPAPVQIIAKNHHLAGFYGLMKCSVLRQARVWHLGTAESWSQFWHSLSVALGKSRPLQRREFIKCPVAPLKQQRAVKQSSAPSEAGGAPQHRGASSVPRPRAAGAGTQLLGDTARGLRAQVGCSGAWAGLC